MSQVVQPFLSPNTDSKKVDVQFLILHYTGCSLEETFQLFQNPRKKVSSHLIIDPKGMIYEVIPCLNHHPITAFHCGNSHWTDATNKKWENLNAFSIGVELVNHNGNVFPYTKAQYQSLTHITHKLKSLYPPLKSPERVLGHEHIAGFRGKVDPGHQFQWDTYFKNTYSTSKNNIPKRLPTLSTDIKDRFQDFINNLTDKEKKWSTLSALLEKQQKHYLETQ